MDWGESVIELLIKKTITGNCTQYSVTCVFFTFGTCCILICLLCFVVSFKLSCVYLLLVDRVCCSCLVCVVMCICCTMWALLFFTLDAGLLARSQYSEGPATGHLDTGFSWFPCA